MGNRETGPGFPAHTKIWSVDYGPFMINPYFYPNATGQVIGTNGANQTFDGDPDANISLGISILRGLYARWGNADAGHYVGSATVRRQLELRADDN